MMIVQFYPLACYMGELYAAAKHDLETANPADVGLGGVSIVEWRKAYLEGCKDMADGIFTRIPEGLRAEVQKAVLNSFNSETAKLKANPPTDSPPIEQPLST